MMKSISKGAHVLIETDNLYAKTCEAFELALAGRKGPVLLDVPMNIQKMNIA